FALVDGARSAKYVICCNAPPIAGELVAAARTAYATQNSATHQRLQNWFEMSGRQAVTRGKSLCGNRLPMLLHCNIDYRGDSKNAFAGKKRHREKETPRSMIGSSRSLITYTPG